MNKKITPPIPTLYHYPNRAIFNHRNKLTMANTVHVVNPHSVKNDGFYMCVFRDAYDARKIARDNKIFRFTVIECGPWALLLVGIDVSGESSEIPTGTTPIDILFAAAKLAGLLYKQALPGGFNALMIGDVPCGDVVMMGLTASANNAAIFNDDARQIYMGRLGQIHAIGYKSLSEN